MSKLSCHVVQDLLPTYADKLTSEETSRDIEEHFAECSECAQIYHAMQDDEINIQTEQSKRDINYLKKIKSSHKKNFLFALAVAAFCLSIPLSALFIIGDKDNMVAYEVEVEGNRLEATSMLMSSAKAVSYIKSYEEDGVVFLETRSVLVGVFTSFRKTVYYEADEPIQKVVTTDGDVLWENGSKISSYASDIYNAKIKYIGDSSGVWNLLYKMNITNRLHMKYQIELYTQEEPYGLTIFSEERLTSNTVSDEILREAMQKYASVILACVDNLSYVNFDYISPEGEKKSFTVTKEEATALVGQDIKSCAETAKGVQELLDRLLIGG